MTPSPAASAHSLERILCVVVVLIIAAATIYAGWIGISNFSRIRV